MNTFCRDTEGFWKKVRKSMDQFMGKHVCVLQNLVHIVHKICESGMLCIQRLKPMYHYNSVAALFSLHLTHYRVCKYPLNYRDD